MKKGIWPLFSLIAFNVQAASLECTVMLENKDGKVTEVMTKKAKIDAQKRSNIKASFIIDEHKMELSAQTEASRLVKNKPTIRSIQLVKAGWERLANPEKGAYVNSNRYTSHVESQDLFLALDSASGSNYLKANCQIL